LAGFLYALTPETLPSLFQAAVRTAAVLIYSLLGGLVSYLWDPQEQKSWRLFIIGMGAPAILLSLQTNIQTSFPSSSDKIKSDIKIQKQSDLSPPSSYRAVANIDLPVMLVSSKPPAAETPLTLRTQNLVTENAPPRPLRTFTQFVLETLRALGPDTVSGGLSVFFGIIVVLIILVLIYRVRAMVRRTETANILKVQLDLPKGRAGTVEGRMKVGGPDLKETTALLEKEDPLEKGLAALGERNFAEAIERFTVAVKDLSDAFFYRGFAYSELQEYTKALRDWETLLKIDSSNPLAWDNHGWALGRLGQYEKAITSWNKAIELNPRDSYAWSQKGWALTALNRSEEAIAIYDEVVRRFGEASTPALQEQVAGALNGIGFRMICEAKKRWVNGDEPLARVGLLKAQEKLAAAIRRKQDDPVILGNQGYTAFLLGDEDKARSLLTRAIALGGEEIRQSELEDAEIYPLPQDELFRALINSI
jgi:tetratricopeptide (TPR) repeat protein